MRNDDGRACCRYILRLQSKNNCSRVKHWQIARETGYRIAYFSAIFAQFRRQHAQQPIKRSESPSPARPKDFLHGFRNPEPPEAERPGAIPGAKRRSRRGLSASGECAGWELSTPKLHFLQRCRQEAQGVPNSQHAAAVRCCSAQPPPRECARKHDKPFLVQNVRYEPAGAISASLLTTPAQSRRGYSRDSSSDPV